MMSPAILNSEEALVPAGHIELFNGKDLSGWTFVSRSNAAPAETWTVAGGVIRCTGQPYGYLRTLQTYKDYRLTVEWRFVRIAPKADNTGVLVHMQLPDRVWPQCIQCQGKHGNQGDLFLMAGAESNEHRGMDANTPLPKQGLANENPVGEWDRCEVICSGDTVTAFINGRRMNATTGCTITSGKIGIQSEGGDIEIRRICLDRLEPR